MPSFKELMMAKKKAANPAKAPGEPPAPPKAIPLTVPTDTPGRLLGDAKPDVPFEFPSETDSPEEWRRKVALVSPATSLGVWLEPGTSNAWIALEVPGEAPNVLLLWKLPLLNRARAGEPF